MNSFFTPDKTSYFVQSIKCIIIIPVIVGPSRVKAGDEWRDGGDDDDVINDDEDDPGEVEEDAGDQAGLGPFLGPQRCPLRACNVARAVKLPHL